MKEHSAIRFSNCMIDPVSQILESRQKYLGCLKFVQIAASPTFIIITKLQEETFKDKQT